MKDKVIYLHGKLDKFEGYMHELIRILYLRIERLESKVYFSHNETVMIERAYRKFK